MNDNINTIMHVLQNEFPNQAVQHQFSNNLHTFRLDSDSETQWLHVATELIEQSDLKSSVYHLLNICSAVDTLLASPVPKWLFLDKIGVHEVDVTFAN